MRSLTARLRFLRRIVLVVLAFLFAGPSAEVHASDLPVHVMGGVDAIHADTTSVVSPRAGVNGDWEGGEASLTAADYTDDGSVRRAWSLGGAFSDSVARRTHVNLEFVHYLGDGVDAAWAAQAGPGFTLAPGRSLSLHASFARGANSVKSRGGGVDYEHQIRESWSAGAGVGYERSSDGAGYSLALSTGWTPFDALELTAEAGASENGAGLERTLPGRTVGASRGRGGSGSSGGSGHGSGGGSKSTTTTTSASTWNGVFQLGLRAHY